MKKLTLLIIVFITTINLTAQNDNNKFDFKIGTGFGFMGTGDRSTLSFENELTYKLTDYFSMSINVGIGRTPKHIYTHNDYFSGGVNIFISPFKNCKKNNFKVGLGYSLMNYIALYHPFQFNLDYTDNTYNLGFEYMTKTINGFSFVIENEYLIKSKYLIGGKAFLTEGGKSEGAVLSGLMLKLGIIL